MDNYLRSNKILNIICNVILKVWAYSGCVLLLCFIIYYVYGGFVALLLLVFATSGILYHAQDCFLFYPELPTHSRVFIPLPSMYNLPYEHVCIKSLDGTDIEMFFLHQPVEQRKVAPTIVFFHGNAGNIGHRLQNCCGLYHNLQCNILLVEYRGYGMSQGNPSEDGLYLDARASIEYLYTRTDINHEEIVVFGRSLGGAVAIDLCSRKEYAKKIWCVIIENSFSSIPEMAKVLLHWRLLNILPLFCYKNKFLSIYKVKQLRIPALFISGLADMLVPPRMMTELYNNCESNKKQLLQLPLGSHNETWTLPDYYHSMALFLQTCRSLSRPEDLIQTDDLYKLPWTKIIDV